MKLSLPVLHLLFPPSATGAPRLRPRSLFGRLSRLRFARESHYHFAQDLRAFPPREAVVPNIRTTTVDSPGHAAFPHMLAIAQEQGLDAAWCHEQLAEGARCVLAMQQLHDTPRPVGMGMIRTRPFWIEEIHHHFSPGPSGCYLYGLYVSPRFRGRGIQHAISSARLQLALAEGRRYAYSIVQHTNEASIKGHRARSAVRTARIDCLRIGRLRLVSIRRLTPSVPTGSFLRAGFARSDTGSSFEFLR